MVKWIWLLAGDPCIDQSQFATEEKFLHTWDAAFTLPSNLNLYQWQRDNNKSLLSGFVPTRAQMHLPAPLVKPKPKFCRPKKTADIQG